MNRLTLTQHLFDDIAARYDRDVVPVFAPLVADFIAYAAPTLSDRVLDLGTGTGLAARQIAPYVHAVIGLDISPALLRAARQVPTPTNVHYARGDIDQMPFPTGRFTLAISSFGLNMTDPNHSLRSLRRAIAPRGRFVLQEWGPLDPSRLALGDLLAEYLVDEPGERLAALRDRLENHPPTWHDHLQDVDDYAEWLSELGFTIEDATEHAPLAIRLPAETYLAFVMAWTDRFEEIRAMDETTRDAFFAEARDLLAAHTTPDGAMVWQPVLFRVTARL